ncbi:hypothetical protein EBU71_17120 [bacterium]|nr:hypothetical protein [Candidatus Elulimicrobium humile]
MTEFIKNLYKSIFPDPTKTEEVAKAISKDVYKQYNVPELLHDICFISYGTIMFQIWEKILYQEKNDEESIAKVNETTITQLKNSITFYQKKENEVNNAYKTYLQIIDNIKKKRSGYATSMLDKYSYDIHSYVEKKIIENVKYDKFELHLSTSEWTKNEFGYMHILSGITIDFPPFKGKVYNYAMNVQLKDMIDELIKASYKGSYGADPTSITYAHSNNGYVLIWQTTDPSDKKTPFSTIHYTPDNEGNVFVGAPSTWNTFNLNSYSNKDRYIIEAFRVIEHLENLINNYTSQKIYNKIKDQPVVLFKKDVSAKKKEDEVGREDTTVFKDTRRLAEITHATYLVMKESFTESNAVIEDESISKFLELCVLQNFQQ